MRTLHVTRLKGLQKSLGLIGKHHPQAVYFTTRWGIHTFFMRFPIDVIILDDQYRVMETVQNLMPNRIFMWNPKYQNVVELPKGSIEKYKLKKGVRVKIVESNPPVILSGNEGSSTQRGDSSPAVQNDRE